MALRLLGGRRRATKDQEPQERPQRHGDHDPAVVSHEDQPIRYTQEASVRPRTHPFFHAPFVSGDKIGQDHSHQHESIEGLQRVEGGLDQVHPLADARLVLPYRPRQRRRRLSNVVVASFVGVGVLSKVSKRVCYNELFVFFCFLSFLREWCGGGGGGETTKGRA